MHLHSERACLHLGEGGGEQEKEDGSRPATTCPGSTAFPGSRAVLICSMKEFLAALLLGKEQLALDLGEQEEGEGPEDHPYLK